MDVGHLINMYIHMQRTNFEGGGGGGDSHEEGKIPPLGPM